MIIIKPSIKDFENITIIAREIHQQHIQYRSDLFKDVDHPINIMRFALLIKNEEILIAKLDDEIIGYLIYTIPIKEDEAFFNRKVLSIEQIAIKSSFQRKGYGYKLMNYLLSFSEEQDCTDLELTVSPENKNAIYFYERLGMKPKSIKYSMKI